MTSSNMGGNLMKRFLLREERGGTGFLFDRKTGKAEAVLPQGLAAYRASADVDSLPLLELTPSHARIAPFCVWVELTRACNLKCPYCGAPNQGASSSLPAAQIAEMFQQFAQCGVFEVRLTGGEPTLHPEFSKIVDAAARIGLFVSVNSNGVLPDSDLGRFASLPIGLYVISLDGPKQVHNALRPPDSYDKAVETVRVLIENGKRVRINAVLCQANRDCLAPFVVALESLGVEALTLVPLRPAGLAKKTFDSMKLSRDEYAAVLRQLGELRRSHNLEIAASYDLMSQGKIFNTPGHFAKRCVAGVEAACVGPGGDLRACILLDARPYVVGNLLREPFSQLWADDKRWGIFREESRLPTRCQTCGFFSTRCPGQCQVMAEHFGAAAVDPYCQLLS